MSPKKKNYIVNEYGATTKKNHYCSHDNKHKMRFIMICESTCRNNEEKLSFLFGYLCFYILNIYAILPFEYHIIKSIKFVTQI